MLIARRNHVFGPCLARFPLGNSKPRSRMSNAVPEWPRTGEIVGKMEKKPTGSQELATAIPYITMLLSFHVQSLTHR